MKTYSEAEHIELVYSGSHYFETLHRIIEESKEVLHLQTYIFDTDATGRAVIDALVRAARRGVSVFMLIDAYGSFPFSKTVRKELRQAGVKFRLFSPLFSSESIYIGRRLHHKIIVADRTVALTGGINIADKYNTTGSARAWLDYAVLCRGEVCEYLHLLCERFYRRRRIKALRDWKGKSVSTGNQVKLIRYRRNDWIRNYNEVHRGYMEGLIKAEESIVIVASYFLPGRLFRKLLKDAAARGVSIKIILAGRSDISSVRWAENYLFSFYLDNKIRIYEWADSVMHGKAMIVDNTWATIGSYNLNFLSHYISIELNADIIDPEFIGIFSGHLKDITDNCCTQLELDKKRYNHSALSRLKLWLAYNFYRWVLRILMGGRKHRRRIQKK